MIDTKVRTGLFTSKTVGDRGDAFCSLPFILIFFTVVFVLGGPGSGKGTNCTRIVERFGYVHLSAGDLLRAERESGSDLADMINTYIKEGKIVPAEVTVRLLRNAMESSGHNKFLVDGFPRDLHNLECWKANMSSIVDVQFLLFLDCPHEVMTERLLERGKTSGRSDDNEESVRKRLLTYEQSTRPIIDSFRADGKVREVNSNRPFEEVFAEVSLHFSSIEK
jgi:UMP-CMP kinase